MVMKRLSLILISICAVVSVQAQVAFGLLLDRDIISAPSFISLSQREYMGTARSMAMGGAFTSLGADMASFGVNPAGFGMYQRSEISMTLGIGVNGTRNYGGYEAVKGNNLVRCALNNIGASMLVYENTGALTAISFAFGYNKVADYNYNFSYASPTSISSMADVFSDIANANNLGINSKNRICDQAGYSDYDMNPYFWTTALGYKAGLINRGQDGWRPDEIGYGAEMEQYTRLQSRGSAGEYSFALGFNFSNIIYFGFSLDIQSISRRQVLEYGEDISYPNGAPSASELPYRLANFDLTQSTRINGTGVGAKFGVVVRPTEGLRIGLAVHTPTYYSMRYGFQASISSASLDVRGGNNEYVYADEMTPLMEDLGQNRWQFATPTRLLAGISYAVKQYAVIAVDYEYDAYKSMRVKGAPIGYDFINDTFKGVLRGVHNIRAGIEGRIHPNLSLRVGGGYTTRMVDYEYADFGEPIQNGYWSVSAGVGIRLGKVTSLDLAYQYRKVRGSDYYSFYSENSAGANYSELYGIDFIRHNIALTLGFKF